MSTDLPALFRHLWDRAPTNSIIQTDRTLDQIRAQYPEASRIERDIRHGHDILTLDGARSLDGRIGMVLAVDLGDRRAWTFLT